MDPIKLPGDQAELEIIIPDKWSRVTKTMMRNWLRQHLPDEIKLHHLRASNEPCAVGKPIPGALVIVDRCHVDAVLKILRGSPLGENKLLCVVEETNRSLSSQRYEHWFLSNVDNELDERSLSANITDIVGARPYSVAIRAGKGPYKGRSNVAFVVVHAALSEKMRKLDGALCGSLRLAAQINVTQADNFERYAVKHAPSATAQQQTTYSTSSSSSSSSSPPSAASSPAISAAPSPSSAASSVKAPAAAHNSSSASASSAAPASATPATAPSAAQTVKSAAQATKTHQPIAKPAPQTTTSSSASSSSSAAATAAAVAPAAASKTSSPQPQRFGEQPEDSAKLTEERNWQLYREQQLQQQQQLQQRQQIEQLQQQEAMQQRQQHNETGDTAAAIQQILMPIGHARHQLGNGEQQLQQQQQQQALARSSQNSSPQLEHSPPTYTSAVNLKLEPSSLAAPAPPGVTRVAVTRRLMDLVSGIEAHEAQLANMQAVMLTLHQEIDAMRAEERQLLNYLGNKQR